MFFGQFPFVNYNDYVIRDFTKRVVVDEKSIRDYFVFDEYYIKDHERADTIANNLYGHPKFAWLIFVINNISPVDWPLTSSEFETYMDTMYGNAKFQAHHYLDDNGNVIQKIMTKEFTGDGEDVKFYSDGSGYGVLEGDILNGVSQTKVTNYEYEQEINENKRKIKVLQKQFVSEFVSDYREKLNDRL